MANGSKSYPESVPVCIGECIHRDTKVCDECIGKNKREKKKKKEEKDK